MYVVVRKAGPLSNSVNFLLRVGRPVVERSSGYTQCKGLSDRERLLYNTTRLLLSSRLTESSSISMTPEAIEEKELRTQPRRIIDNSGATGTTKSSNFLSLQAVNPFHPLSRPSTFSLSSLPFSSVSPRQRPSHLAPVFFLLNISFPLG